MHIQLDQILDLIAALSVATSLAIPAIKFMIARTRSEKIMQVELWALQCVTAVDVMAQDLSGADKRSKAIEKLHGVIDTATQNFNFSEDDVERYIDTAYSKSRENTLG